MCVLCRVEPDLPSIQLKLLEHWKQLNFKIEQLTMYR